MASVPLTKQHLESHFPGRLDRHTVVNSYLREQKRNALVFANEGRELALSWTLTPERQMQVGNPDTQAETFGFGTPVLKPRVSQRQRDDGNVTSVPRQSDPKPATVTVRTEKRPSHKPDDKSRRKQSPPVKAGSRKKSSEKRPVPDEASDHEREARALKLTSRTTASCLAMSCAGLAERRERKRANRAITRPPRTTVHEEEGSPATQDKAKQKSKGKKQTLLGGLALLHGFTATNIGKNRLTVSSGFFFAVFPHQRLLCS